MMNNKFHGLAVACGLLLAASVVQAQETIIKVGVTRYQTHAKTTGITGIGVPAGADADVGSATTVIFVGERLLTPNIGIELVLGVPPKIKSRAAGSVKFLGEVLEARNVAPTLLLNYHFGREGDAWRPYVGAGINFTRFTGIKSSLAKAPQFFENR
jgi:outer membrane protein